jgi:signal transduction histidine kinase
MIKSGILHRGPRTCLRALIVVSIVLLVGLASANAEERVVYVGVYENAPKIFIDANGQPAGFFIDIIQDIARQEGWELVFRPGTWAEGLDRLARGDIDLMPDVAYTAERAETYDFHQEPVLSSWFQVYARKGSGIKSILDLAEKRVVVLERSVQQAAFEKLAGGFGLNITLIALPDYKAMFEMISAGDADAAITNRFYGLRHAEKYDLEDTAVIFSPSNLFFATRRGSNAPLLSAIDSRLARLKQEPQSIYYQSLKRWTSETVQFAFPDWAKILGLILGVVLVVSLMGSFWLNRQVNARTSELRQINSEMEARIQRRTEQLAQAMEQAQAADRIKSAFLATMSHELRTPLNSIIGFTGILLQGLAGPLNDEQQKQMRMVQTSSRHLLALINDVLDISKIEAGQLTLAPTAFDLRAALEKSVQVVLPMADKKGIAVNLEMAADVAQVTADQRRLEQVLLNLLNNALKFTEKGQVRVTCRTDNDHYLLSVADTGIGMQPDEIPKLFQPFHQIDSGLTRKHEGTGLGLSICKKLIVLMGGSIEVESQWGRGSTFTLRIPIQAGAAA